MCQFIEDEEEEVFESEEEITFYPTRPEVVLPLFDESIWMTGEDLLKALHIGDIFQVDRREEGMDFAIYVGGTGAVHAVHSAGSNVAHINLEPVRDICENYACRLFNFVDVARKKGLQPLSRLDSVRNAKNLVGLPLRAEYGRRPEYLPTKCVYNARLSFPVRIEKSNFTLFQASKDNRASFDLYREMTKTMMKAPGSVDG